jgi:hypothetical protein
MAARQSLVDGGGALVDGGWLERILHHWSGGRMVRYGPIEEGTGA